MYVTRQGSKNAESPHHPRSGDISDNSESERGILVAQKDFTLHIKIIIATVVCVSSIPFHSPASSE